MPRDTATAPPTARRALRKAAPLAGPVLIVASVLVVMHRFVLHDVLTASDLRAAWLPFYCFLGKSLAHGHLPAWNPHIMAGAPFAADPQSGWMSLPPMALFTALPCDVAIRAMVLLQPALAGLGLYWFARSEGLARPSATVGGLSLAVLIAGSNVAITLPFSATLAWTAVALAACSRYLHARAWPARLPWCLATAAAWGQVAAAHASVGLMIGSLSLGTYLLVATLWGDRRGRGLWPSLGIAAVLLASLLPVNMAFLVPRLAYAPHASLSLGYGGLARMATALGSRGSGSGAGLALSPQWPLKLATTPGARVGAVALAASLAGFWDRRLRALAISFAALGLVCFVASLHVVSAAVPEGLRHSSVVDFYLHNPYWFGFGLLLAVAGLAATGFEAVLRETSWRARAWMIGPGLLVWGVLPVVFGATLGDLVVPLVAAFASGMVVALARERPGWAGLLVGVLAVELLVGSLAGQGARPFEPLLPKLGPVSKSRLDLAAYLRGDAIAMALRGSAGRYATVGEGAVYDRVWNESMLTGAQSVDGYDPVQPLRYWEFLRLANPGHAMRYNDAFLVDPPDPLLDLLGVRQVVSRRSRPPEPDWSLVARSGPWALYERPRAPPRGSLVTAWTVQPDALGAIRTVVSPGFDGAAVAVLDRDPGVPAGQGPGGGGATAGGSVRYQGLGSQAARFAVDAPRAGVLVVRNSFDPRWRAWVDGRPAPVLVADGILQGVPVPAGRHAVVLEYRDPTIGIGLLGSALSIAALLAAAALLRRNRPTRGTR